MLNKIATDMSQERYNDVTIGHCVVRVGHYDDIIGHCLANTVKYSVAIRHLL